MMQISLVDRQIVITFEDSSKWLFSGFINKNGMTYVRLYMIRNIEGFIADREPTDMYIVQADQYVLAERLNTLIRKGLHDKCDPNQMFIDSFITNTE